MNRLNIMEGVGHPLKQDDLDFLQNIGKDGVLGLSTMFGVEVTLILSGCTITDDGAGNLNVAEGWLLYKGEVMKVDAHSIAKSGSNLNSDYAWVLVETNVGDVSVYADATSHNVYKQRRAELQVYTNQLDFVLGKQLFTVIQRLKVQLDGAPVYFTLLNGWSYSGRFPSYAQNLDVLTLNGILDSSLVTDSVFGKLPVDSRPNVDIYKPIAGFASGTWYLFTLKIGSNGDMSILDDGGMPAGLWYLDNIKVGLTV